MLIVQGKLIKYQVSQCDVGYIAFISGANEGLTDHLQSLYNTLKF